MVSKTRMISLVRGLRWQEVETGLRENPALIGFRDRKGRSWLHLCCSVNLRKQNGKAPESIRTAEVLLDVGLDLNAPAFTEGRWKATPLWYAIAWGHNTALARFLLERGSDPNHCLWAAVNRDNADAIRLLMEHGADDPTDHKSSPLLAAIQWNRFAAMAALLELGADVNYQDAHGMTALHYLLKKRSDNKHIRLVLQYGARGDLENADGVTAVAMMMRRRDAELRGIAAGLVGKAER